MGFLSHSAFSCACVLVCGAAPAVRRTQSSRGSRFKVWHTFRTSTGLLHSEIPHFLFTVSFCSSWLRLKLSFHQHSQFRFTGSWIVNWVASHFHGYQSSCSRGGLSFRLFQDGSLDKTHVSVIRTPTPCSSYRRPRHRYLFREYTRLFFTVFQTLRHNPLLSLMVLHYVWIRGNITRLCRCLSSLFMVNICYRVTDTSMSVARWHSCIVTGS